MSGCNCKSKVPMEGLTNNQSQPTSFFQNFIKYSLKTLMFLIFLMMMPLLVLYIIYLSFNMIVLNGNIDIKPLLLAIGDKFRPKDDEDYSIDDFENLTEDDVILLNVEDITEKTN
jgi:hypothetical protein